MKIIAQNYKNIDSEIKKLNIKAEFNDTKVTSVVTFTYVELFKRIINLSSILKKA